MPIISWLGRLSRKTDASSRLALATYWVSVRHGLQSKTWFQQQTKQLQTAYISQEQWCIPVIPALRGWSRRMESLRSAWVTRWNPVSSKQTKQKQLRKQTTTTTKPTGLWSAIQTLEAVASKFKASLSHGAKLFKQKNTQCALTFAIV